MIVLSTSSTVLAPLLAADEPASGSYTTLIFWGHGYMAQWSLRPRSTLYWLYISSFSSTSSDVNGVMTYIALLRATILSLFLAASSASRRSISSLAHVRGR